MPPAVPVPTAVAAKVRKLAGLIAEAKAVKLFAVSVTRLTVRRAPGPTNLTPALSRTRKSSSFNCARSLRISASGDWGGAAGGLSAA